MNISSNDSVLNKNETYPLKDEMSEDEYSDDRAGQSDSETEGN